MPSDKSRIQVILDDETNGLLASLAGEKEKSLSATAADLIREALELHEDRVFSSISNDRIHQDNGKRYNHNDAWDSE